MKQIKIQDKKNKKIYKKFQKGIQGITLLTLILTIIIMLIIAGIGLNLTIGDNGIFTRAENAHKTWNMASKNEEHEMNKAMDFIDRYLNGNKALNTVTGEEKTNSIVYDKLGNKVVVPAGFKIINPEDDVTKGIIIEDVSAEGETEYTKGSQFVWVPVGDIIVDDEENVTNISLGRYQFDSNGIPSPYNGAYTENSTKVEGENEIAKNLDNFISKVGTSHGFYIGRYELGDAIATEARQSSDAGVTNPVTCKKGVYPYASITQAEASDLCKNMYNSKYFDSDLINSYVWDTTIVFIQLFSGDNNYSKQSGKTLINSDGKTQVSGNNVLSNVDSGDESLDVRCNIYDMAGNAWEWSTETDSAQYPCVLRGGDFWRTNYYTDNRFSKPVGSTNYYYATRPILYL